jgi:hypothetical protein
MTALDRGYGPISRKKMCSRLMPKEVFDGQAYSIDEFYGKYSAFFEKPWKFYRDFKETAAITIATTPC